MAEPHCTPESADTGCAEDAQRPGPESDQVWELVRAQRRELAEIESRLEAEFTRLAAACEERLDGEAQQAAVLDERTMRLSALEQRLGELRAVLSESLSQGQAAQAAMLAQIELGGRQLDDRHAELLQDRTRVRDGQREITRLRERYQADLKHLAEDRERCSRRSRELDAEYDDLAEIRSRTAAQRQRIAEELRERRADCLAELHLRETELDRKFAASQREHEETLVALIRQKDEAELRQRSTEQDRDSLAGQLDAARRQAQELREQMARHDGDGETAQRLKAQLERARQRATDVEAERDQAGEQLKSLRGERAELESRSQQWEGHRRRLEERAAALENDLELAIGQIGQAPAGQHEEIDRLTIENSQLVEQVNTAESQASLLAAELNETSRELAGLQRRLSEASADGSSSQLEDLCRRLEMALDDLKAERVRSAELQKRLAQSAGQAAAGGNDGANDWESQKRRMLAALEADDAGQPQSLLPQERFQIEQALRATERAVAEKDREIAELHQLLQQQSTQVGSLAIGATAVAEVLDKDEIIRQERENLHHLQHEWREKLRQAEVDISVDRAKLARERADLEEKLRVYEVQQAQRAKDAAAHPQEKPAKPDRGRWLTRLGLKEPGE